MLENNRKNCKKGDQVDCARGHCNVNYTMDVLSLIKHSILADNNNPITKHFDLGRQTGSAGPEMVWKIFDAVRLEDKKVS